MRPLKNGLLFAAAIVVVIAAVSLSYLTSSGQAALPARTQLRAAAKGTTQGSEESHRRENSVHARDVEPTLPTTPPTTAQIEAEDERITRLIRSRGGPLNDEVDRRARDIALRTATIASQTTGRPANVEEFECERIGCIVKIRTTNSGAEAGHLQDLLVGLASNSPVLEWPGSRLTIPPMVDGSSLLLTVFLIREDSPVTQVF